MSKIEYQHLQAKLLYHETNSTLTAYFSTFQNMIKILLIGWVFTYMGPNREMRKARAVKMVTFPTRNVNLFKSFNLYERSLKMSFVFWERLYDLIK